MDQKSFEKVLKFRIKNEILSMVIYLVFLSWILNFGLESSNLRVGYFVISEIQNRNM